MILLIKCSIFLLFYCYLISSLSWSSLITTNIKNGGDIITYGSFQTLAQGNGRSVNIYYQEYSGTTTYWSYGATLVANLTYDNGKSSIVGIGESLSAGKGLLTLDILFASAPQNNTVFVFQDTRTHWTQKQFLVASDSEKDDYFGYDVAVDVLNPQKAIISAPYDDDNGLSSGSAYIFVSTPSGTSWTLTQKLRSEYITPNGNFGNEVAIVDNKIIVTSPGTCQVYLYSQQPTPIDETPFWSEQQVLYYSDCGGYLTISQYNNDLVIGSPLSSSNSGKVYLLESKTYRGECDGDFMPRNINFDNILTYNEIISMKEIKKTNFFKSFNNNNNNKENIKQQYQLNLESSPPICDVTRWSQTQSLTLSNNACGYFGSNVAIYEDVLIVSRLDTSNSCPSVPGSRNTRLLMYERDPDTNTWTLSQTYTDPVTYSTSGLGTNGISLYGTSFVAATSKGYNRIYSFTPSNINCVYVTFEDTFGDGWSNVELLITNTEDYTERYGYYCDSVSNPRSIRYCPLNVNNYHGKSFKFQIANPLSHPYHHEIRWRVQPEATGVTVYGDMRTKLEVIFDGTEMTILRGTDVLENEIKLCENECRSLFEPSSSNMVVLPITLYDVLANTWQDVYDRGTSYIITDRKGKKVYARGTLCAATLSQTCYIELPYDEKFAIRVSGALDTYKGDHSWSFCGMTGSSVDHVAFITSSSSTQACWVEEDYTQGTYCQSVLHSIPLHGILLFHGLQTLKNLSHTDETVLSTSLQQLFKSENPLITTFKYSYDTYYHALKVEFITYIPTEIYGLDGLDPDNLHNAFTIASSLLTSGINSGELVKNIENYIQQHQYDNLNYNLNDHGLIELQLVEEERTWKNYLPISSSPSPFYYETPSLRPTYIPSPSSVLSETLNPAMISSHTNSEQESNTIISSPIIIGVFIFIGVIMIIYLANKSSISKTKKLKSNNSNISSLSSISSSNNKNNNNLNKKTREKNEKNYHELSTSSHHKKDPLYGDDDDDDEEEEGDSDDSDNENMKNFYNKKEKDDIESVCFTECIELDDQDDNDSNSKNNNNNKSKNNSKKYQFSHYNENDTDSDDDDDDDDDNDDNDEEIKGTRKDTKMVNSSPSSSIRKSNSFQPLKKNHNSIQNNDDVENKTINQSKSIQSKNIFQNSNSNVNGPIIIRKYKR